MSRKESLKIETSNTADILFDFITSTKFRRSSLPINVKENIKMYISNTVLSKSPITLFLLFGGYKQFQLASAPYPEWAEFFNVEHMMDLAKKVASVYEGGVRIVYRSDDSLMTHINNYSKESLSLYADYFNRILDFFAHQASKSNLNIEFMYSRPYADEISFGRVVALMDDIYSSKETEFFALSEGEQKKKLEKAYKNYCWIGERDLSGLTSNEKESIVTKALFRDEAYVEADYMLSKEFYVFGIPISFRKNPLFMHYGSCSSSNVQFWVGEGFISGTEKPWIFSSNQQKKILCKDVRACDVGLAGVLPSSIKVV